MSEVNYVSLVITAHFGEQWLGIIKKAISKVNVTSWSFLFFLLFRGWGVGTVEWEEGRIFKNKQKSESVSSHNCS